MAKTDILKKLLEERIVILDGAMGTNVQKFKLTEEDYRGDKFKSIKDFPKDFINNNDILSITKPEVISEIHQRFLDIGGCDIVETNTFSATTIAQNDFFIPEPKSNGRKDQNFFDKVIHDSELREIVAEANRQSVRLARKSADNSEQKSGTPKFVAGAIGPLPVSASISPEVEDPGFRQVTFEQLVFSYREQIEIFVEEGVDILLIETIFDTLNAKAAIYAISEVKEKFLTDSENDEKNFPPTMLSNTLISEGGRNLSNQNIEAFYISTKHAKPLAVGMNCALGPQQMLNFAQDLIKTLDTYSIFYPNAGLPNPLSETGYDQTPEDMAGNVEEFAKLGLLNIVGGCCGSTPEHIASIKTTLQKYQPRKI